MKLGTTALAKLLGISRQRVNELGRLGKISREKDGRWNLEKVQAQLGRTLDKQQAPRAGQVRSNDSAPDDEAERSPAGGPGSSYEIFNRARAAKEIALAKEKQLDLKQRQGQLVEITKMEAVLTLGLTAFKNRLLLAPDRLAPKVAVCSNVLECREIIDEEMRDILSTLSEIKLNDAA
jgi:hypothetical protein